MSSRRSVGGFTLVELLVVISIIGMLMALLLPAVQSAREAGRRNTCANNEKNLATAMISYDAARRYFPGYANQINAMNAATGVGTIYVTGYVVPLLPYLERNDLYRTYTDTTQVPSSAYQALLVCPSNPPTTIGGPQLAYIVNGGLEWQTTGTSLPETVNNAAGAATSEFAFNGVCFNAAAGLTGAAGISGVRVGSDYVSSNDGATYTALLTENNQAAFWTLYTTAGNPVMAWAAGSTGVTGEATLAYYLKNDNTFVWYQLGASNASPSTVPNGEGTFPTSTLYRINGNKTALPPASASSYAGAGLARPSSNHTGGVNLFFCDGHYRFIAEDVNYLVLRQLMTSNYQATANYVAQAAGSTNYMNMPLDDSMY